MRNSKAGRLAVSGVRPPFEIVTTTTSSPPAGHVDGRRAHDRTRDECRAPGAAAPISIRTRGRIESARKVIQVKMAATIPVIREAAAARAAQAVALRPRKAFSSSGIISRSLRQYPPRINPRKKHNLGRQPNSGLGVPKIRHRQERRVRGSRSQEPGRRPVIDQAGSERQLSFVGTAAHRGNPHRHMRTRLKCTVRDPG